MTEDEIKSNIRTIRDWPKSGINFRDVTTLFENPECYHSVIEKIATWATARGYDSIAGIDARGFILSGALAFQLKLPLVLVRKKGKLPYSTIFEDYELEYGTATVETHETELVQGKKVLVVDDLLATGGTALAAIRLMRRLGAEEVDFAAIIDLVELPGRKALDNAGVTTFTVCGFNETE